MPYTIATPEQMSANSTAWSLKKSTIAPFPPLQIGAEPHRRGGIFYHKPTMDRRSDLEAGSADVISCRQRPFAYASCMFAISCRSRVET